MTDVFSKRKRSEIMSHIKLANTAIELKVRSYLHRLGFRYRINDKRYAGRPDLVLPKYNTIIFINGCFWHHHGCKRSNIPKSNQEYWENKITKNIERDEKNISVLEKEGWNVIVIWECEINKKFTDTMNKLIDEIKKQTLT